MNKVSLFIFRRDLRLQDNTALNAALNENDQVHVAFIFDAAQKNHPYFSANAFEFMANSLKELNNEIKKQGGNLNILVGNPTELLKDLKQELNFKSLYVNQDYTPFAQKRDQALADWCQKNDLSFKSYHDYTLHPPNETKKADGKPYTIFTPFYRNASKLKVRKPETLSLNKISDQKSNICHNLEKVINDISPVKNKSLALKGGRSEALKLYDQLTPKYDDQRDFPGHNSTSHLSAHHKFGTVSMRESYYALGQFYGFEHTTISELFWHDFFTQIGFFFPHVFEKSFTPKFENLAWQNDEEKFKAWCEGKTGFPMVDAGMRELNTTGYMHNRVRMITASFLIKNLEIDWHWGEKYFAQKLIDYDPAINNGNWQWAASTGCDAQPFFRIFNPWRQQERFDKESVYIKQWIPELKDISSKEINNWSELGPNLLTNYPVPIVDHKSSSEKTKTKYKKAHENDKA